MHKQFIHTLFLMLIIGIASSCNKTDIQLGDLTEIDWELTHIRSTDNEKKTKFPKDAKRNISIRFIGSTDEVEFIGICNVGRGNYSFIPGKDEIEISDVFTTMMLCAEYNEWEDYVGNSLVEAYKLKLSGKKLTIYSHGNYDLFFKREK